MERFLLLALSGTALLIAVVTGYGSNRSIAELREAQAQLVQEIRSLKRARETELALPSISSGAAFNGVEGAAPVANDGPIAAADDEESSRFFPEVDASARYEAARSERIDRIASLRGKARAKALEDLEALVSLGDEEARELVVGGLRDPDPRVRESAVGMIAKAGDPDLLAELEPLVRDPDRDVRRELAEALEDASRDQAGPILMKLLDDQDPAVVEDAVKSLGAIGYGDARPRIAELVDSWNPELTGAVGEAMRDFGDASGMEAAIDALVPALEHEDPAIRQRAVKEIGQIGGPSARAYLEAALDDEDYEVKREARKRIAKL